MIQTPRRPVPRSAGLSLMAALVAILVAACAAPDTEAGGFHKAPPLRLPDLEGSEVWVRYGDARLTLVNFWATWCMPCREEIPQIERLVERYGDGGFRAVGIAVESGEPEVVKDYLARNMLAVNYPILMGDDEVSAAYGDIQVIPTTYLIGSDGTVLETHLGVTEDFEARVGREIEKHLASAEGSGEAPPGGKGSAAP